MWYKVPWLEKYQRCRSKVGLRKCPLLDCQPLTSVQLTDLYPILQGNMEACDEIFSTVAYNFNKIEKRKKVKTFSPINGGGIASNRVCQDIFVPKNIPSSSSKEVTFHRLPFKTSPHTRRRRWYKILVILVIIPFAYQYFSMYGWSLGLYRKKSISERIWKWIW